MFMNDEKPKDLHECFERMKKACETLENEYGYSKYAKFNPPLTEKEIQDLEEYESRLGFKLPEAYREFLKFSNGAIIDELKIYELDMIGMPDDYVPDDFLPITSIESVPERMAISTEDGNIYMFWEGEKEDCDFEDELMSLLEKCEDEVDNYIRKKEREERRKAGITEEQEMFQIYARLVGEEKAKLILEERKKRLVKQMNTNIINEIKIDFSLEEKVIIDALNGALDKVSNSTQEMLNSNKKELQVIFNDLYTNDRTLLFKTFQCDENGISVLNLEQQKILFDSIEVKQKCQLYNTISVDSRKNFYNSLSASDAEKFKIAIRIQAVNDARMLEQTLLDGGMCTRDWDIQQIRDISSTKQNPIPMNFESSVWD